MTRFNPSYPFYCYDELTFIVVVLGGILQSVDDGTALVLVVVVVFGLVFFSEDAGIDEDAAQGRQEDQSQERLHPWAMALSGRNTGEKTGVKVWLGLKGRDVRVARKESRWCEVPSKRAGFYTREDSERRGRGRKRKEKENVEAEK